MRTRLPAISELRCCIGSRSTYQLRRRQIPVRIENARRGRVGECRRRLEVEQGNRKHRFGVDQHFASVEQLEALRGVMMRNGKIRNDDLPRSTAIVAVLRSV